MVYSKDILEDRCLPKLFDFAEQRLTPGVDLLVSVFSPLDG